MRIGDWSSDVCSSDLDALPGLPATMQASSQRAGRYENAVLDLAEAAALAPRVGEVFEGAVVEVDRKDRRRGEMMLREPAIMARIEADAKSEEQTSELQSLMRNSDAVFCLKKTKNN